MEMVSKGWTYQVPNHSILTNIGNFPCNEFIGHGRGRGESRATKKWHNVREDQTAYYIRRMG